VRDDQFSQPTLYLASDQGMIQEHFYRTSDEIRYTRSTLWVGGGVKLEDTSQISPGSRRVLYLRHVFGFGRAALLPAARARK